MYFESNDENRMADVKRYSSTFDNIKSLLKDNSKVEANLEEPLPEFEPSIAPDLIRVVSLPAIGNDVAHREQLKTPDDDEDVITDCQGGQEEMEFPRLPPSPLEEEDEGDSPKEKEDYGFDRPRECNGISLPMSKSLDTKMHMKSLLDDEVSKKYKDNLRLDAKIPVNLLIEDQIVKKALNENRRQLEKVSDAIKEIESVKNSESYSDGKKWKNGDSRSSSKRNSYENDCERKIHDGSYERAFRKQQHSSDSSETSKTSSETEFDRRRHNGYDIYASGRRLRPNGTESHNKNDQKQIENVIDAILQDSKNPDFQVCAKLLFFNAQ